MKCTALECFNPGQRTATRRAGTHGSDLCPWCAVGRRQQSNDTQRPDIQFYCGLNEKYWNHHAVEPGASVCIAPVTIGSSERKQQETPAETRKPPALRRTQVLIDDTKVQHVLLDSGAFSDGIEVRDGMVLTSHRLSFDHALQRQIAHAYAFHYAHLVESIVSYDLLIDETWQEGGRSKKRWSVEAADYAVRETIAAAHYLSTQRSRIDGIFGHHVQLVLSAQGVDTAQYVQCAQALVTFMQPDDIFGFGGFCITGLRRQTMLPAAASLLPAVFAVLGESAITRVHVFGVVFPTLLGYLLSLCDRYGLELSTDSAGPCVEPVRNGKWGYGSWTNPRYTKPSVLESCRAVDEQGRKAPTCSPNTRCAGLERCRHTHLTRHYLAHFRACEPDLVRSPPVSVYRQLVLREETA